MEHEIRKGEKCQGHNFQTFQSLSDLILLFLIILIIPCEWDGELRARLGV